MSNERTREGCIGDAFLLCIFLLLSMEYIICRVEYDVMWW